MDAFSRCQADLCAGRHCVSASVGMYRHIGLIIDLFIFQRIVHTDQHVAATAVDDILCLKPVEMIRRILTFLQVQKLLCIYLGIFVRHGTIAVTNGDQGKSHLVKISHAVVGDIPTQHTITDFIVLVTDTLPLLWGKMTERWQIAVILFTHCF